MSRANEYMMPFYETIVPMQDKVLTRSDYKKLEAVVDSMIAAERQRWEVAARSELFMALIATAETVGALDAHDIERMRQAALDGERGKERI